MRQVNEGARLAYRIHSPLGQAPDYALTSQESQNELFISCTALPFLYFESNDLQELAQQSN
jgi:hypothetical protein